MFFVLLFSPETDREEHTEAEIREEASNLQMHKMHQELSIGNILAKTSEIGVWCPSQVQMHNMWQTIYA